MAKRLLSTVVLAGWLMGVCVAAGGAKLADPRKPGGGGRFHNKPEAGAGGITAKISPVGSLEEVIVVEPTDFRVYLASIDRYNGQFTIKGLPPGKYDLILKFRTNVLEGLRLDVPGGFTKIPKEDWKYIQWETWRSDDYFNDKTIARLGGNGERVKLLVEQVRDKKTFEPDGTVLKGIMIRRFELTEMRKTGQVWQIANTRHLYREERHMDAPGRKLKFIYSPKLGGIRVGDRMVELPPIDAKAIADNRPAYFYKARHRERKK